MNQMFNAGNASDESNQIVQHVPRTDSTPGKENVQCYNCNEKGHYASECHKPKVHDAKYFREQMLLAMKDKAESNLSNKENDFMLDNAYDEETLDELTTSVMLMARIQPADGNAKTLPSYDAKAMSQESDTWDRGQGNIGCWGEWNGTVSVRVSVRERLMWGVSFLAGK
nr:hypothetical protein [Tanacetum cinerariifolium]